jgi:hypothetical protein
MIPGIKKGLGNTLKGTRLLAPLSNSPFTHSSIILISHHPGISLYGTVYACIIYENFNMNE